MVLTIRPAWSTHGDGPDGSRTAERLAIRRAVLPMIEERGYDAVTVDDITAATGVSRRTFFRLFGGKHQILSCDHEVYHLELHTHLLQHQSERSIGQAARGAALIVDSLTSVHSDAVTRSALLTSAPACDAEERRWYDRHQSTIAHFLTDQSNPDTTVDAEMSAAAIIAAARVAIRDYVNDPVIGGTTRFDSAIQVLSNSRAQSARQIAIIETSLPIDELLERINRS